jgi:hypothetical protein
LNALAKGILITLYYDSPSAQTWKE